MNYNEVNVMEAFKIYSQLGLSGQCDLAEYGSYLMDDKVRGLVDLFCTEVNCTIIVTNNKLLLVPITMVSPFHISNERLKNDYLPKNALNSDIYLMYFAMINFYGMFYDSYNTTEPILEFVSMTIWLEEINDQIQSLSNHSEDVLEFAQKDMNYNWKMIINKWDSIDDTNEKAKKQDSRTNSRLSFLNAVKKFMIDQDLIEDIGNGELALTDKSKDIVSKYFMDTEYNRGILEFLYMEEEKEVE